MMRPTLRVVSRPPRRLMSSAVECLLAFRENFLPRGKIGGQSALHRIAERNIAFFLPLAANQNGFCAEANVVEVDAGEFRIADAASVEQFEHQAVAFGESGHFRHFAVETEFISSIVGTRGSFLGSFGVATSFAGFCSTTPSCASQR